MVERVDNVWSSRIAILWEALQHLTLLAMVGTWFKAERPSSSLSYFSWSKRKGISHLSVRLQNIMNPWLVTDRPPALWKAGLGMNGERMSLALQSATPGPRVIFLWAYEPCFPHFFCRRLLSLEIQVILIKTSFIWSYTVIGKILLALHPIFIRLRFL